MKWQRERLGRCAGPCGHSEKFKGYCKGSRKSPKNFEQGRWHDPIYTFKEPFAPRAETQHQFCGRVVPQSLWRRNRAGEREKVRRMGQWGWERWTGELTFLDLHSSYTLGIRGPLAQRWKACLIWVLIRLWLSYCSRTSFLFFQLPRTWFWMKKYSFFIIFCLLILMWLFFNQSYFEK